MEFNNNLIQNFLSFFAKTIPSLDKNYTWPLPKKNILKGFTLNENDSLYKQNIALKKFLTKEWKNNNYNPKKTIASWVVKDWGGIRRISEQRLKEYVDRMEENHNYTPLKGIASYSKILAAAFPEDYAIYDARVAASLNAIQLLNPSDGRIAFHYLAGRNNIVGNKNKKIGFTEDKRFSIKNLTSSDNNFLPIDKNNVYNIYINLLKNIVQKNPNFKLHECEMVLFAQAEELCTKVMN